MILIAILTFILCGDFVFLGVMSQTVLITVNPSFYWWGIAGYICAGFFGIWFIIDFARCIARRRHKKALRGGFGGVHQRSSVPKLTNKMPARNVGGQRKRSKRK